MYITLNININFNYRLALTLAMVHKHTNINRTARRLCCVTWPVEAGQMVFLGDIFFALTKKLCWERATKILVNEKYIHKPKTLSKIRRTFHYFYDYCFILFFYLNLYVKLIPPICIPIFRILCVESVVYLSI